MTEGQFYHYCEHACDLYAWPSKIPLGQGIGVQLAYTYKEQGARILVWSYESGQPISFHRGSGGYRSAEGYPEAIELFEAVLCAPVEERLAEEVLLECDLEEVFPGRSRPAVSDGGGT